MINYYILSWLIPLAWAIESTFDLSMYLPEINNWFISTPLVVLLTWLHRTILIDVFGVHTTITYRVATLTKEELEKLTGGNK